MTRSLAVLGLCGLLVGVAQAQDRASDEARRHNERGATLQQQGKVEEAITEFRRAVELEPGNVTLVMNLAHAYGVRGRLDEGIAEYRKVLARQPANSLAQINLGVLYDRKGLHDEAIQEFEQVLQREPTNASALKSVEVTKRNKITAEDRNSQIARAVKQAEARPRDPRAAYAVARLHAMHGQSDEAFSWLSKAMELGYDNLEYLAVDPAMARLRDDPRFPKRDPRPVSNPLPR